MKQYPNIRLPLLQEYAVFIQKNFLKTFIKEVQANYKASDIPFFRSGLVQEELFLSFTTENTTDFLQYVAKGNVMDAVKATIELWKGKLPGIQSEHIRASDIVLINKARKMALLRFLSEYLPAVQDAYPLLKELEEYDTFDVGLSMEAFAAIQQEEIAQREKRLHEAQELAGVGNWEYDTVSKTVKWSEELYKMYAIDPSVVLSSDEIISFIHPEDFVQMQKSVRQAAQDLGSYSVEYRIKRPSGETRILVENGYAERNKTGRLIYRGTTQDITLLKRIEQELHENEGNFRLLAENSTDIISKHALDSTIRYITPSCYTLTGYTPEELVGRKAYDFYHPEDLYDMERKYKEVSEVPDSTRVVFRFRKKDGSYLWFESIAKTILDEHQNPVEIIATNRDVTEQVVAEAKLKRNEALLSGVFNSSLSGIQVLRSLRNKAGQIIDFQWILANDAVLRLWGLDRAHIIGRNILDVFPGVREDQLLEKYIRAAEGETLSFKHYYKWEGLNHWFNIVVRNYEDGIILSTYDITAEMKAEEQLQRSNIELEEKVHKRTLQLQKQKEDIYSVLMQAPAMISITRGPNFIFELANPFFLKIVGKTEAIIGRSVFEVFPEIKGKPIDAILHTVYATGERFIGNEVLVQVDINNDGHTEDVYFNFVIEPLRNQDGAVDGILNHAVDVTQHVEARMLLEESEQKLRTLADHIPNLAWMANPDGWIFWYNERWYEYTGTTPEQMEGWGWQSVHDANELPSTLEAWKKAIENGEFFEKIIQLKGLHGFFRPFLTRVVPVKDQQGNIIRWFGTNTDIAEQIRTGEELERKNRELLRINNDLDNFIYTASHDLKSPVSNLEGLLNLVTDEEEGMITENGKNILPLVAQSMTRLKTVIQELTEIAQVQKDIETSSERINLKELFQEVLLSCENVHKHYHGSLESDFSQVPAIRFSKKNLRSILFNIVNNALKYSDPDKSGHILVKTERQHAYILLSITDNGLGIPENQLGNVFTMFKRFHTHVEGSGVGLYLVKRIVENAGGKIEVESKVGKGTTFNVYFIE